MVKKGNIAHYREKLDRTLASHDLTDEKKLEALVKDQILRSSKDTNKGYNTEVIAKRTAEVWDFLAMLRSASENCDASLNSTDRASWKLKQDNEEFRVMYREGPVGSPFHSLLVEGYVEAPLDVCLCISWETVLYSSWFPETLIPTFKIVTAKSVQKIRLGEQISLVRVKLSWPLSSREAILHYFEFEYLKDGLVLVLINTIPGADDIQMETHGYTSEGIPEAGNTVRIDLVGGFALQKVTENRSYFRTIGNMDVKLDFVPPSLINFISRQLIGSGFRLYQKTVASVSKGDETITNTLNDPLYSRIREALYSNGESKRKRETQIQDASNEEKEPDEKDASTEEDLKVPAYSIVDESSDEYKQMTNEVEEEEIKENKNIQHEKMLGDVSKAEDQKIYCNGHVNGHLPHYKPSTEIEEVGIEGSENVAQNGEVNNIKHTKDGNTDQLQLENLHKKVRISAQVEQALGTLDKMIDVVREAKVLGLAQSSPNISGDEASRSTMEKHVKWADKGDTTTEKLFKSTPQLSENGIVNGDLRSTELDFHAQEATPGPTLAVQKPPPADWSRNAQSPGPTLPVHNPPTVNSSRNTPTAGNSPGIDSPMTMEVNGIHENRTTENKKTGQPRKWRLCCLHLISGRIVS